MEYKSPRLRSFVEITAEIANRIQNEKISTCVSITDAELKSFRNPSEINDHFIELSIVNNFEDLGLIAANIDTTDIRGRLQWMHLRTYLNGGKVFFRRNQNNICEILYLFSMYPRSKTMDQTSPISTFNGLQRFRAVYLSQILSTNIPLALIPSVVINIEVDGELIYRKSVMISSNMLEVDATKGTLDYLIYGFDDLRVFLSFNNPEIEPVRIDLLFY